MPLNVSTSGAATITKTKTSSYLISSSVHQQEIYQGHSSIITQISFHCLYYPPVDVWWTRKQRVRSFNKSSHLPVVLPETLCLCYLWLRLIPLPESEKRRNCGSSYHQVYWSNGASVYRSSGFWVVTWQNVLGEK